MSNMMGFLFAIVVFYLILNISDKSDNRRLIRNFILMASPYILMIPVIGIMVEVRLWMPIILGSVLLGQLNFAAIKIPGKAQLAGKAGMLAAIT